MNVKSIRALLMAIFLLGCFLIPSPLYAQKNTTEVPFCEAFGRGVVAVRISADTVLVSWRYLSKDLEDVSFNVYRDGKRIAQVSSRTSTSYYDLYTPPKATVYEVYPVVKKRERKEGGSWTLPANAPIGYVEIPLVAPQRQETPDGRFCSYTANDASVSDLDGDGELEVVLKWDPTNSKDNSHNGYTGTTFLDAYEMDGTHLWRIDMGRNIRSGAHYTQFMVFDFDGDGAAELVAKTSDATVDGKGKTIGDASADYRQRPSEEYRGRIGIITTGPEFLTVFDGRTGAALYTRDYIPQRGRLEDWGDNYANRSERYLAAVAYLDGKKPSVVMCRGYYTRSVLAAFDWDGKELKERWVFDTNEEPWHRYAGQGNHNLRVGDVDGDGCDEITYGSCAIDHDGTGLYNTRMGHGDAIHQTAFYPDSDKLQVWDCHENKRDGSDFRDAATGDVIFQIPAPVDNGRCMAADIDPTNWGLEMWSQASKGIRNVKGEVVEEHPQGLPTNMAVWWDGDLLREMLDHETVSKYDWTTGVCKPIFRMEGCQFNNGTKSNPCLQGDVLGDWREEVITRTADNTALRIYVSPLPTEYRFHTFLEDRAYRLSIATQNVAYNQPTQTGFYFGAELVGSGKTFRGYHFKKK